MWEGVGQIWGGGGYRGEKAEKARRRGCRRPIRMLSEQLLDAAKPWQKAEEVRKSTHVWPSTGSAKLSSNESCPRTSPPWKPEQRRERY